MVQSDNLAVRREDGCLNRQGQEAMQNHKVCVKIREMCKALPETNKPIQVKTAGNIMTTTKF